MSALPVTPPPQKFFRRATFAFAFVLGCQAAWILAAEIARPSPPTFPTNVQAATETAGDQNAAIVAASLGLIRADLWAECALIYLNESWGENRLTTQDSKTVEQARACANRTLTLAPHDARTWLVLASLDSRFEWLTRQAAALRMSYYTGANETELVPLRLLLAVRSDALSDKDFQQLVRNDIRLIVAHKPELKPAIVAAYRHALPAGQQFLDEAVREIDPTLLTKLRSNG